MRLIRSFFFGSLAMLAAVVFISMPASALDREVGFYSAGADPFEYPVIVSAKPDAIVVDEFQAIERSRADAHRAVYIRQNQPTSTWRFAADAYSRIDPHILVG